MQKNYISCIKDKCETGKEAINGAIDKIKDISLRPKFYASFSIKSKKLDRDVFSAGINFDKEFSLSKIILAACAFVAGIIVLASYAKCISKCDCDKNNCDM